MSAVGDQLVGTNLRKMEDTIQQLENQFPGNNLDFNGLAETNQEERPDPEEQVGKSYVYCSGKTTNQRVEPWPLLVKSPQALVFVVVVLWVTSFQPFYPETHSLWVCCWCLSRVDSLCGTRYDAAFSQLPIERGICPGSLMNPPQSGELLCSALSQALSQEVPANEWEPRRAVLLWPIPTKIKPLTLMWAQIFNASVLMMEKKEVKNSNVKKKENEKQTNVQLFMLSGYMYLLHNHKGQPAQPI